MSTPNIEGKLSFYERVIRYIYNHFEPFLTDRMVIRIRYRLVFHRGIHLIKPQTFYEKIQWLKLHDRKPVYHQMADKYGMRQYISNTIGEKYLVPLIGHWDNTDEIDINALPDSFVLKCTHDSQSAVICRGNKAELDWTGIMKDLSEALKVDYSRLGREWAYSGIKPRLVAEELLTDETGVDLKDYKVFCFNGKPRFTQVDYDRFVDHKRRFFDNDWNVMEGAKITYHDDLSIEIKKPFCLDEMLELSAKLSQDMAFLRVDWYVTANHLYIGELTFYPGCGFEPTDPYELDVEWGKWLEI